jgi:O-antigen/teichoic acid export membrane protein
MLRGILRAFALRGIASIASLGIISVLANTLGIRDFSVYLMLLASSQLISAFCILGFDGLTPYLVRTTPHLAAKVHLLSAALTFICQILLFLIVMFFLPLIAESMFEGVDDPTLSILLCFILSVATTFFSLQVGTLQGLLNHRLAQWLLTLVNLLCLALVLVVILVLGSITPIQAIFVWIIVTGVCGIIAFLKSASVLRRPPHATGVGSPKERILLNHPIGYAANIYFGNLINAFNSRSPIILTPIFVGGEYHGYVAGLIVIHDLLGFFAFATVSVSFSTLAGVRVSHQRTQLLGRACRLTLWLTAIAAAGLLMLFPVSVGLLLGPEYRTSEMFAMLWITVFASVAHSSSRILCTDLAAQGRTTFNLIANLFYSVIFIISSYIFAQAWGEWGIAFAFSLSLLAFWAVVQIYYFRGAWSSWPTFYLPQRDDLIKLISYSATIKKLNKTKK